MTRAAEAGSPSPDRGPATRRHHTSPLSERGAVAAEFALMLPILLMLIFGMIELGLAYQRQEALHAGAREGARIGSVLDESAAETRCYEAIDGTSFSAAPVCNAVGDCSSGDANVVVTAEVSNTLNILFITFPPFTITGKGDFRCE